MVLRVISTKLTEEEHWKVLDICRQTDCSLSSFLKYCIMDFVEKEDNRVERPIEETKIAPKIRYQYF